MTLAAGLGGKSGTRASAALQRIATAPGFPFGDLLSLES